MKLKSYNARIEKERVSEKLQQVWIRQLDLSYLTTMESGNIEPIEINGL